MTLTSRSDWAGVLNRVVISFQDPFHSEVANFLANLHSQGYQTSPLNAYRSAVSNVHDRVDDMDVGKHPLVFRLLKGAFHARPPLPHYTRMWNVQVILNCMQQWVATTSLPLKLLSLKLVMLLLLSKPIPFCRSGITVY